MMHELNELLSIQAMSTTIFTARKIVTMNPANPEVTAVAVRDGMIIAAGTLEECASWGPHTVDDRFAGKVLVPGFVEAHGHTMDALTAMVPYLGYYPYPLPDGTLTDPIDTYDALVTKLRHIDAELPEGEPLFANGFDPIFFPDEARLDKRLLDQVSTTRPIFIRHASGHLATVNSALLVDFSADWCLTCKLNLATAIETERVKAAIESNRIVPLLADWTEESPEIKAMLESLQSKSIPVLAVFPSHRSGEPAPEPIILRDLITESQVLTALKDAGPSKAGAAATRSAAAPMPTGR